MLEEFLLRQEIDIAFLQEVTHPHLNTLNRYTAYINEGTTRPGTAILAKEGIILTNVTRLHSGRDIAAKYQGIWLVNICAPSGAARKNKWENFYNGDLTYLLPASHTKMILAGNFNCALAKTDCMSQLNCSRALDGIIRGFKLTDV
jgi:exonuclease III